jgi:hypothetical protein
MLPPRCAHVALNVAIEHPLADLLADLCGRSITCASVLRWPSMLRGSHAQVRSITWRLGRNRKWLALVLMP